MPLSSSLTESESADSVERVGGESLTGASTPAVTVTGDEGAAGERELAQESALGWKEQGWEDVAYESLARNLRSRTEGRRSSK